MGTQGGIDTAPWEIATTSDSMNHRSVFVAGFENSRFIANEALQIIC